MIHAGQGKAAAGQYHRSRKAQAQERFEAMMLVLSGTILIDYFFGVNEMDFIVPILTFTALSAFGLLLLTLVTGFAYDVQRRIGLHKTPRWVNRATS
jgi:hypothetical protein